MGINGTGKTTTVGKLAKAETDAGRAVIRVSYTHLERVRKPIEEYKPTDMSMLALQPLGEDAHFFNLAQCDPDLYGTQPIKAARCV